MLLLEGEKPCILTLLNVYSANCQHSQLVPSFCHSSVRSSTPVKEDEDEKILALQQEVQKLQGMVHELWMCHQAALLSGKFIMKHLTELDLY
jgi:hypothetical protein